MNRIILSLLILSLVRLSSAQDLSRQIFNYYPPPLNQGIWAQAEEPEGRPLYPGLFAHTPPVMENYSRKLHGFAGVQNGALYFRESDQEEIRIVAQPENGWRWDVEAAKWSVEGHQLLVRQIDDRAVPRAEMKDTKGRIYEKEYSYVGEPVEKHQYYIVDITTGNKVKIPHGHDMPYVHAIAWHTGKAWLLRSDRMMKHLELLAVDPASGKFNIVISETADEYMIGLDLIQHYDNNLDRRQPVGFWKDRIIWTSERSGYGQLYVYTLEGQLIGPVPKINTKSTVEGIMAINDNTVYSKEVSMTVGSPDRAYEVILSKYSIKDNQTNEIFRNNSIMRMVWAQDSSKFWLFTSTFQRAAMEEFYADGRHAKTAWEAELTPLLDGGYDPEFVWTRVKDDTVRAGSVILKPKDFDPDKTYPVVEYNYAAPFNNILPMNPYMGPSLELQSLANEGYIVVMTDARSTMYRGRDFRNKWYGELGHHEMDDHAWVLRKLAESHPFMDLNRVGISGHSMGGYYTIRAMIQQPGLYKAGYALAPNVDPVKFRVPLEPYFGCLPDECPEAYAGGSITDNLAKLQGELYYAHGTNDQHIPFAEALRLKAALDEIGYKKYHFEEYEGNNHILQRDPRSFKEMVRFFKRSLK